MFFPDRWFLFLLQVNNRRSKRYVKMMETFPRSQVLSKLIIDGKYEKYLEIFTARPAANDFVFL